MAGALEWFSHNIAFSFIVGMFYGIMSVDLVYSLGVVSKIRKFAVDNKIMVRYEELKLQIRKNAIEAAGKNHWFLQFKSDVPLIEHLKQYIEFNKLFRNRDEK